jgi:hypothetical protein
VLLAALAQSVLDDASSLGAPLGLGAFILAMVKIITSVTAERARVCEADRARCTERLDAKDVIVANLTSEVSRLNAKMDDNRKMDDDARRYLDNHFSNIQTALAEIRAKG